MNVEDPRPPNRAGEEEVAHLDERTVSKVFAWSGVALVVILISVGVAVFFAQRKKPAQKPQLTALTAPAPAAIPSASAPVVSFTDVTRSAGIGFVHHNGAAGEKLLPETMGGGVAFFDYDNDGAPDLLFVNGTAWPWEKSGKRTTLALFHNDGTGRFVEVAADAGLGFSLQGMGAAVGDVDNDGFEDLLVTGVGERRLLRNVGGKFIDISKEAGIESDPREWSTAACFFDMDNDGLLDLFVGNYVKWSREIDAEVGYKIDGTTRAYAQPMNFEGAFPRLYQNLGGGKFRDISTEAGVHVKNQATRVPATKTLGVVPVDVDEDGFMDLLVANDTTPNCLFHNQRGAGFKEIGAVAGIAFDNYGGTRGAMGIDAARYRGDGALGVVIGNFANEMNALYVAPARRAVFSDEAIAEGIGPASRLLLKFGIFFFDYDLDGRLDVLSANGHLDEEIVKLQKSQSYRQPAQLFWNSGAERGATFVPVDASRAGADLFKPIVGRGCAYADIDRDGDLDVVLTQVGGPPLLLRNDQKLGHHWLRVRLVGTKSNRSAIGATLAAKAGGKTLVRTVTSTRGYLSASEPVITLGLGTATAVESIEVTWPSGKKQAVKPDKIDTLLTIEEPR